MEPRPYGRGDAVALVANTAYNASFNGATAIRPWRHREWQEMAFEEAALQWSHGHTAVETTSRSRSRRVRMSRFNGATAIRPWRRSIGRRGRRTSGGFKGATAIRPWRHYTRQGACKGRYLLQWSHGHTAVETLVHCVAHREVLRASMEPRPYGRGDCRTIWAFDAEYVGFNGATAIRPWRLC